MARPLCLFVVLVLSFGLSASADEATRGREPVEVIVTAGVFDLAQKEVGEGGLEVRFGSFDLTLGEIWLPLGFSFGGMVNEEGGYYLWSGFQYDWEFSERWRMTTSFGAGIYSAGEGKNLGGPVEFRSSLEISYALAERARLSVNLYHLSNGIVYDVNPGSESLVLGFHRRF